MTATVTPPHIVDKFDDLAPMSGDNLTRLTYGLLDIRKPPGQLWERVAERSSERTPSHNDLLHRGPRAAWPDMGLRDRSGIIRAGERIK